MKPETGRKIMNEAGGEAMSLSVKVYSDYVCPFCFLAKAEFEAAIEGRNVEVEWLPFELRPAPMLRADLMSDPSKPAAWDKIIGPLIEQTGVEMKLPAIEKQPYTNKAFEGYYFAREQGKEKEYQDRVFRAYFQESKNIEDVEVLTEIAADAGLNETEFKAALRSGKYKEVQQKAVKEAYEKANISAVPAFIIGDERVQGFTDQETFKKIIDQEYQKNNSSEDNSMQCNIDGSC